jgi:succinate-acetate transporter protein
LAAAGVALAVVLSLAQGPVARLFASWTSWRDESTLAVLALIGGAVYGAVVFALFGKQWLAALRTRKRSTPPGPPPPSD